MSLTVPVFSCPTFSKEGNPPLPKHRLVTGSVRKGSTCKEGDRGSIPGSGRSPGEGIGHPLQYSWASLVAQLVKNLPAMQETWVQSLGLGRSPGEGKGYPLQYSGWENSTVHGVAKSWTRLSNFHFGRTDKIENTALGSYRRLSCSDQTHWALEQTPAFLPRGQVVLPRISTDGIPNRLKHLLFALHTHRAGLTSCLTSTALGPSAGRG